MQTKQRKQSKKASRNAKPKQKARKQVIRTVERGSANSAQIPISTFSIASVGSGHIRVRGHEILGSVIPQTSTAPSLAAVFDSNPACWKSSRLALTAAGYERYRYNSARIRYVPNVSTTVGGSIAVAIETDPDEQLPGSFDAVQRTMNSHYAGLTPVWSGMMVDFKRASQDLAWYEASVLNTGSLKDVSQFLVYAVTDSANQSGSTLGRLVIEYDIEFIYPELEQLDGGTQYVPAATLELVPGAAGSTAVLNTTASDSPFIDAKYGIMRVLNSLPALTVGGSSLLILAGTAIYYAHNGAAWNLYPTLEAARSLSNPLKFLNAQASGFFFPAIVRALSKTNAPR